MATGYKLFPEDALISETENYRLGSHLYIRASSIQLDKQLSQPFDSNGFAPRFLHYYCDTMSCSNETDVIIKLPPVHAVTIFARDFMSTVPKLTEIVFGMTDDPTIAEQQVSIYCGNAPSNLLVRPYSLEAAFALFHDRPDCPDPDANNSPPIIAYHQHVDQIKPEAVISNAMQDLLTTSNIDHASIVRFTDEAIKIGSLPFPTTMAAGRRIRLDRKGVLRVELIENVPVQELEPPSLADLQVHGRDLMRADNLSKLLHQQLSTVSRQILRPSADIPTLIARLKFIIRCTRASATRASLAADAQKLLDRLELPTRTLSTNRKPVGQYYVPQLGLADLLERTNDALNRVKRIDQHITETDKELKQTTDFKQTFATLLRQMGNNMQGFIDRDANYQKAEAALADMEAKRRDMENYVQSAAEAMKRFNEGMKAYKEAKESAAWWSIFTAAFELAATIGIAIATCGAGAPLTLGSLGKAQEAITKGVKIWDQVKVALEKIVLVCAKLVPKLYAAGKSTEKLNTKLYRLDNDTIKAPGGARGAAGEGLKEMGANLASSLMAYHPTDSVDYLGILADWDEFDIEVDIMFYELARQIDKDQIDGMTEYQVALKNQAVRGRTVIMAMRNSQEARQFYYRQETERLARAARLQELHDMAEKALKPDQQQVILQTLRWNMLEEFTNARRNMFVRCHQALLGLVYISNRPQAVAEILDKCPVHIDSTTQEFENLLVEIGEKYDQAKLICQTLTVPVSTSTYPQVFQTDWKQRLAVDKVIYFAIPDYGIQETAGMHRVRISKISVTFDGMKAGKFMIQWDWELGPHFLDKNASGNSVQYYMPTQRLRQNAGRGDWVDDVSRLPRPSVFCHGRIVFKAVSDFDPEFSRPDVDLSQVTAVNLEFQCEAILI